MTFTTAIDTNVLSAIMGNEPSAHHLAAVLEQTAQQGALIIHGSVFAELMAMPDQDEQRLVQTLRQVGIQVDWQTGEALWREAGRVYGVYAQRRRGSGGGRPRRLLADSVIGAHALGHADQLLTLDSQHYQAGFPNLKLLTP
ncbi:type II toxin-antitoxin system VapC family toxin [Deinococcus sp.]|uniref:type II toxin-antitoxin system VapC family toxin n=1 Tax=Deinococcus sp. TaxID=47478 RepID=UPI003B5AD1F3